MAEMIRNSQVGWAVPTDKKEIDNRTTCRITSEHEKGTRIFSLW